VCTLVCTFAYSNPVYGSKIVLGISVRFPYSTPKTVKIGTSSSGLGGSRSIQLSYGDVEGILASCVREWPG